MGEETGLGGVGAARSLQRVAQGLPLGEDGGLIDQHGNTALHGILLHDGIDPQREAALLPLRGHVPLHGVVQAIVAEDGFQPAARLRPEEGKELPAIRKQRLRGHAHDALAVGADILALTFPVENEENFVDSGGQQVEKLFPVGDFPVLAALGPAGVDDEPHERHAHQHVHEYPDNAHPVHARHHCLAPGMGGCGYGVEPRVKPFQIGLHLAVVYGLRHLKAPVPCRFARRLPPGLAQGGDVRVEGG